MRDSAARAILQNQEEAQVALAERERGSELFEYILSLQAQQFVSRARHQAQQEVLAREAAMNGKPNNLWNLVLDHFKIEPIWVTNNLLIGKLRYQDSLLRKPIG